MTASIPDFSAQQQLASERLFPAFCLALALHAGLFLLLPLIERTPVPAQVRIAVQMAQMREVATPAEPEQSQPDSPPQPVTPPKPVPKPEKVNKPILAAKADTPPDPLDVPEQKTEAAEVEAVTPAQPSVQASSESADTTSSAVANSQSGVQSEPDPNAQFEIASRDEAWKGYGQLLHDMISKNKTYPQIAIRRNLQGTVLVSARFSKGRLVEIILLEPGSGHKVLDDAALAMLRKAVDALPVRGDLSRKSFTVVVPVDFKLEG